MTTTETTITVDDKHAAAARKAFAAFVTANEAASRDAIQGIQTQTAIARETAMAKIGDAAGVPCTSEGKAALAKILAKQIEAAGVKQRADEILTFAVVGSESVTKAATMADAVQKKCEGTKARDIRHKLIRRAFRMGRKLPTTREAVENFTALHTLSQHEDNDETRDLVAVKRLADKLAKASAKKYGPLQTLTDGLIGGVATKIEAAKKSRREAFKLWVDGPPKPKAKKASAADAAAETDAPADEKRLSEIGDQIFSGFMASGMEESAVKASLAGFRKSGMTGMTMASYKAFRKANAA